MKNKPDNRRDNVVRIQRNIDMTMKNINEAEEMIALSDNKKTKNDLEAKNDRRKDAVNGFIEEIKDEAHDKENGYKQ